MSWNFFLLAHYRKSDLETFKFFHVVGFYLRRYELSDNAGGEYYLHIKLNTINIESKDVLHARWVFDSLYPPQCLAFAWALMGVAESVSSPSELSHDCHAESFQMEYYQKTWNFAHGFLNDGCIQCLQSSNITQLSSCDMLVNGIATC
jgi:hypothetical protein